MALSTARSPDVLFKNWKYNGPADKWLRPAALTPNTKNISNLKVKILSISLVPFSHSVIVIIKVRESAFYDSMYHHGQRLGTSKLMSKYWLCQGFISCEQWRRQQEKRLVKDEFVYVRVSHLSRFIKWIWRFKNKLQLTMRRQRFIPHRPTGNQAPWFTFSK